MSIHDEPQPLSAWSDKEVLAYLQRFGDEEVARFFVPVVGNAPA
jgi:hypothetical protein